MTDLERELGALREQVDRMQLRQRGLVALLGSIVLVGAVGVILASRPALSDPAAPLGCGHLSQLYCFAPDSPALASQVNSNFESAFQGLDAKLDKTGGTVTGDLTTTGNLTLGGFVSLGEYTRPSSGSGGGATAYCDPPDLVVGGQAACTGGAALGAAGSTFAVLPGGIVKWGYYGTCVGGATVNVSAYCVSKAHP